MSDNKNLENKGWAIIADTLEQEMPQKRKRRPFLWFFFGGVAMLLLVAFLHNNKSVENNISYANNASAIDVNQEEVLSNLATAREENAESKPAFSTKKETVTTQVNGKEQTLSTEVARTTTIQKVSTAKPRKKHFSNIERKATTTISNLKSNDKKQEEIESIVSEDAITANSDNRNIEPTTISSSVSKNTVVLIEQEHNVSMKIDGQKQEKISASMDEPTNAGLLEVETTVEKETLPLEAEVLKTTEEVNEIKVNEIKVKEVKDSNAKELEPIISNKSKNNFFPYLMMEGMYAPEYGRGYAFGGGIAFGNDVASLYAESSLGRIHYNTLYSKPSAMMDAEVTPDGGSSNELDPGNSSEAVVQRPDYSSLLSSANVLDFKLGTRKTIFKHLEFDLGLKYRRYLHISNVETDVFQDDSSISFGQSYIMRNQLQGEGILASYDIAPEIYLNIPLNKHWKIGFGYSHGLRNMIENEPISFSSIVTDGSKDSFYNRNFSANVMFTF